MGAIDFSGAFDSVDIPELSNVKGGFNMQSTGDFDCDGFDKKHKDRVIRGSYTCSAKVQPQEQERPVWYLQWHCFFCFWHFYLERGCCPCQHCQRSRHGNGCRLWCSPPARYVKALPLLIPERCVLYFRFFPLFYTILLYSKELCRVA